MIGQHGKAVPGRADAEAVKMAALEALHHEWRRQDDEVHVAAGIDAARLHPEPELVVVAREREHMPEGQRRLPVPCAVPDDPAQSRGADGGIGSDPHRRPRRAWRATRATP